MSDVTKTLNFNAWVDEHGPSLKPPVANKEMFPGHEDFIVMVVGGPNQRTDFHVDPYEEVFYQVRGNMHVNVMTPDGPARVDIREENDRYILYADLPGVKKDDLNVEIEGDQLTLRATREQRAKEEGKSLHSERYQQIEYFRSFSIGDAVNPDGIEGSLEDGVLRLVLPKQERVLPRRIQVG